MCICCLPRTKTKSAKVLRNSCNKTKVQQWMKKAVFWHICRLGYFWRYSRLRWPHRWTCISFSHEITSWEKDELYSMFDPILAYFYPFWTTRIWRRKLLPPLDYYLHPTLTTLLVTSPWASSSNLSSLHLPFAPLTSCYLCQPSFRNWNIGTLDVVT